MKCVFYAQFHRGVVNFDSSSKLNLTKIRFYIGKVRQEGFNKLDHMTKFHFLLLPILFHDQVEPRITFCVKQNLL